ncbi:MAG: sulfatase [Opitutaceae bacterium]|nr:sulfatase [Opitutaceae bacterium]
MPSLTTGCLAALALILTVTSWAGTQRHPNILVIVADDMGYADVGMQGCRDIPTPNIDALARGGVRFTQAYVSGAYCSPSRAGLMTGRYQQRFGHEFNAGVREGLPVTEVTMADRLKAAGYFTGLVGKWHLGEQPEFHPQSRGFDEFFGFLGAEHTYFPAHSAQLTGKEEVGGWIRRGRKVIGEETYLTDAFAREAVSFIDRHAAQPFFLYLAFNAVHSPLHATEKYLSRFAHIEDRTRRIYAAMLSAMDDSIGDVMTTLRAHHLEENTLIFFFSDNGGPTYPNYKLVDFTPEVFAVESLHGVAVNGASNAPLRGSKRQLLEGGIRVPFVVQWKGTLPAGIVEERPVIQLDVLPTALAAAGVEASPGWGLDGVNLLPYINGSISGRPHETLYWRFGRQRAVRHGDWKLVKWDEKPFQLYHLSEDIGETHDLAGAEPKKAAELQTILNKWLDRLPPPLWIRPKLM